MRRIFLIRHGRPDFPDGERLCLGRTDLPLGALGRLQACLLGAELHGLGLSRVYSSPLIRAMETARAIDPEPVILPGMEEQYAGDWDGLSFREIKEGWPELYEARGRDRDLPMPGAESQEAALERAMAAMDRALSESRGDIAIVAHRSIGRLILRELDPAEGRGDIFQSYCSYRELRYDGTLTIAGPERSPRPELSRQTCLRLLKAAGLPEHIQAHCMAVSKLALTIAGELALAGRKVDIPLVESAALLHDIARLSPDHAALGAAWLRELGYPRQGDIVLSHHDCPMEPLEAAVVAIADKCIHGDEPVGLEERFRRSLEKCPDTQGREAHARRLRAAREVKKELDTICGKEVIP